MQNENSNNFSWKNKLEDVNGLSGEMLTDKNAAWEKLHDRLHKKSSRIKPVWYWIAAACMLAGILTPLLIANKKQPVTANKSLVKPGSKKLIPPPAVPEKEIFTTAVATASGKRTKIKATGVTILTSKFILNTGLAKDSNKTIVADAKKETLQNQAISPEIIVDNSFKAVPVVAVVKKKLKVVHINELGDPVEEVPDMTRIAYNRSSQSRFFNREVFMSSSHTSNSAVFNIFKTKNTPPN